jgi:putative membrane protein
MAVIHHTETSSLSIAIAAMVALTSFIYVRGWNRMPTTGASVLRPWRLASFLCGLLLIWAAICSPLAAYDHNFLTVHMIQHLLLMTFSPALVLLGEPVKVLRKGWPQIRINVIRRLFQLPFVRPLSGVITHPIFCWIASALTLLIWHVPALFTLGMQSRLFHSFEQISFLIAGFLFWWPVVRPWPSISNPHPWLTLLYLFLGTLPCDILSGFLVFSDRVAYALYFSVHRQSGFSVLQDQQCAAALMWICVTLVYLVPTAILSVKLLSPRYVDHDASIKAESHPPVRAKSEAQAVEAF